MSRSIALVRFPDGHIDAAVYTSTTDSVLSRLHTLEVAGQLIGTRPSVFPDVLRSLVYRLRRPRDTAPVEVWTAYAGGKYWFGVASRRHRVLLDGTDPYVGYRTPPFEGSPAWVPPEFRDDGPDVESER